MSQKGILIASKLLSDMQQTRLELISMGCDKNNIGTKSSKQDILLGQLFAKANDAIKKDFAKIVCMNIYKGKKKLCEVTGCKRIGFKMNGCIFECRYHSNNPLRK